MKHIKLLSVLAIALFLLPITNSVNMTKMDPEIGDKLLAPAPDADYDGINDAIDAYPNSNAFSGKLNYTRKNKSKTSNIEFVVDYRKFFSGNTTYSKDLAVLGSLLSADIYDDLYVQITSGTTGGNDNATTLGTIFGLSHVEDIKILANNYSVDKDDTTEFVIGHRLVQYQSVQREIVIISVRGTNGTNAEWSSNFDVGADTTEYYASNGSYHPDWTNKLHHKGFDVAKNRIVSKINDYFNRRGLNNATKSIFITGHSRGAAIANLLGAHFTGVPNVLPFTYTFAAPNTTTASTSGYSSVFNIVNSDDIIPMLPLSNWGFGKYGTTRSISVADNYENNFGFAEPGTFEWLVGEDYNNDGGTQRTINAFAALANNRSSIYQLDNTSDGTVWQNNLGHWSYADAYDEMIELEAELRAEKLFKYARLEIEGTGAPYHVAVQYSPAYLMQDLANLTTGTCAHLLGHDVKGKYASAKASFIASSGKIIVGGMEDPHLQITYYLLARNNFQSI